MTRFALTLVSVDGNLVMTVYETRLYTDASACVKAAHEWTGQEDMLTAAYLKEQVKLLENLSQEPFRMQLCPGMNKVALVDRVEVF